MDYNKVCFLPWKKQEGEDFCLHAAAFSMYVENLELKKNHFSVHSSENLELFQRWLIAMISNPVLYV